MLFSKDPVISQAGCPAAALGAASMGAAASAGRAGARTGAAGAALLPRSMYIPILIPRATRRRGTIPYRVIPLRVLFFGLRPGPALVGESGIWRMTGAAG
jgi:hypothetical protein